MAGGGFPTTSHAGQLTINPGSVAAGALATTMRNAAWWVLDLSPLWGFPDLRGENTLLPYQDGRYANPRRIDQGVYVLGLVVLGNVDKADTPITNTINGVRTNLDYLWANVGDPPAGATREASLLLPDNSTTRTADVQCRLSLVSLTVARATLTLELTVPAGRFE